MRALLVHLIGIVRLTRLTTAFAGVANVWFVVLWTLAVEEEQGTAALRATPLWLLLAGGAVSATGLYAFAVCLNDVVDANRDRVWRKDRPIATGQVSAVSVVVAAATTLAAAVLGSAVFGVGGVVLTVAVAMAAVVFNAAGQHVPAVGMLLLASIYAGHMLVPNGSLRFVWPVLLVMTHALLVSGLAHVVGRKRPVLSVRAMVFASVGWAAASGALLTIGWRRSVPAGLEGVARGVWPEWAPLSAGVAPGLLFVLFFVLAARRVRRLGMGPRAAEKVWRYGSLWLALYPPAWLLGVGAWRGAALTGALALGGLAAMVTMREVYSAVLHPAGYRR